MAKVALLIGVSEYQPGLDPLPSAIKDVEALKEVLANPEMGGFNADDISVLKNPDRQKMETAIYSLFANRQKDDLVLLYFSGHGVLDDSREFYLTSGETRKEQEKLVPPTAVAARSVQTWMEQSRSQRQVIILDSCFSGAFAKGVKAKDSGSVNVDQFLGGKGRAILTASTSTQYALAQDGMDLSVYTHYLVEGIRTGGADQDDDGWIAVEELHAYASSKVREAAPAMTPEFYPVKEGYTIVLAKSPKDDPQLKYRKQVEQRAHQEKFTIPARRLLNSLRNQLGLSPEIAEAIETEALQPFREYQRELQEYEQTLTETLQAENPLSQRTLQDLKDYQQHLALLDEDVASIETKLLGRSLQSPTIDLTNTPQPKQSSETYFDFEVITVNAEGKEQNRRNEHAQFFTEDLGNGIKLEMVRIPAGKFLMGTLEANRDILIRDILIQKNTSHGVHQNEAEQWVSSEMPQHHVKVPEFWMGKFAVTQAQWSRVAQLAKVKLDLNADPASFKGAKRPVEQVSWDEAVEFCDRLSQLTQKSYRLPTEAEWEYACRAGTNTPFHFGETITSELVNCAGNYPYGNTPKNKYRKQTTDVGSFPANAFGLYDMHGNVWEWCADQWYDSYIDKPDQLKQNGAIAWIEETTGMSPNADAANYRLLRGGSWNHHPKNCRSAYRLKHGCEDRNTLIGFRVVCILPRTL